MGPSTAPHQPLSSARRLARLLEANRRIVAELSLDGVLERIVEAAREVTGARYAALGVIGTDGLLERFIHAGMDAETVAAIGHLPKGGGVLGALLSNPQPIRLHSIADDPRSSGLPAGHPPMTTFLGVPIRSRDAVYGNLYLTDRSDGQDFTEEDEELVRSLATTAGTAIANARLYEEAGRRQEWLRASAEISQRLLASEEDDGQLLRYIGGAVKDLVRADVVSIVLPSRDLPDTLEVAAAVGLGERELQGLRYRGPGSVAWRAIQQQRGALVPDIDADQHFRLHLRQVVPVTQSMALPLQGAGSPRGAVVAGRIARVPFAESDLEIAESFASQAALSLELSDSRADRQRLAVLEDRDRIARDLHDHVVQRLFAAGLRLEGLVTISEEPMVQQRLAETIDDLDSTIRRIRTSIFALQGTRFPRRSVRRTVLAVVEELAPVLGFEPRVEIDGPLDTLLDEGAVTDIEAVLREALTNVARHARASDVEVDVRAEGDTFTLTITDNGVGLGAGARRSGLTNLRVRAERRGGTCALASPGRGVRLTWSIPTAP